jgi:hypothetical protein
MIYLLKWEMRSGAFFCLSRQRSRRILFLLLSSFTVGSSSYATPIGSVSPVELLQALPPVPIEWKCRQSMGKMEFSVMNSPETTVSRQYQIPTHQEEPPPLVPPLPGVLNMLVMDLGSLGNPVDNPPVSTKSTDSFPLSLFTGSLQERKNNGMFFMGTIGSRLFVQITGQNMKPDDFKKILQALDFTGLATLEKKLPSEPLKEETFQEMKNQKLHNISAIVLENIYIDELNPQRNRHWQSSCVQEEP